MSRATWEDIGRLILRVAVGGLMLLHGISKLRHGIGGLIDGVHEHGLPTFFAYGVYLGEVLGPILLILGLFSRIGGLLVAFNMIIAMWLAHSAQIFTLNKGGGAAVELNLLYLFGGLAIAMLGAGRFSVRRGQGRLD